MSDYAFIDSANIFHAAMHSLGIGVPEVVANLSEETILEMMIGRIEGRLRTIKFAIQKEFGGNYQMVLVLDNKSLRKREIYPEYKLGRDIAPVAIQIANMWAIKEKPFPVCESPGNEGDDCIAALCERNASGHSIIISADRDLWQMLSDSVAVWCPMKRVQIDELDVINSFKVGPRGVVLHKSCWGDSGDGVPNILPRTRKRLLPLIQASDGTLEDFKRLVTVHWNDLGKKCQALYFENEEQLAINFALVELDRQCEVIWH